MGVESQVDAKSKTELDFLLEKVHEDAGFDFRNHRRNMLVRRLERRLHALNLKSVPAYIRYLDTHPDEYRKFVEYLTIKVSGFCRCPQTFEQLARLVLPEIVAYKKSRGERALKFWSAACARGEETYSIAILLDQYLGDNKSDFDVAVYGSDISHKVLGAAREGIYFAEDINGFPEEMRRRFFTQHGKGYLVTPDIRKLVDFAHFDLTSAAPLPVKNPDCIFCCNVLIYWQRELQAEVLGRLCEALATPGYLVLGEVETPTSNVSHRLVCLDNKAKIYKKVR